MNIFSVGLAVRVGLGLVAILVFLPSILGVMVRVLERSRFALETLY
jgi:flagellar biosynthesis protein FliR